MKEPVVIHPQALANYRDDMAQLEQLIHSNDTEDRNELIATLRWLVDSIVVRAPPNSEEIKIELRGWLSEIG